MADRTNIRELQGRYAGETIFVIASGPSMDHIPSDFFAGRTVIGVNQVYRRFPCTFVVQHHHEHAQEVIDRKLTLVISEFDCGERARGSVNLRGHHYFYHHVDSRQCQSIDLTALDRDDSLAISASTTAEALHFAAHLGAAFIILCGADGGRLDGKMNFEGYNGGGSTRPEHLPMTEPLTQRMVNALRQRGRIVVSLNPFMNFGLEGHRYSRPPAGPVFITLDQDAADKAQAAEKVQAAR